MSVRTILERLAQQWSTPRHATGDTQGTGFRFRCSIGRRSSPRFVMKSWPPGLQELWESTSWARLFEDVDFGQWGLELLSPDGARGATARFQEERWRDHLKGDLVIGRFLGDQELLVVRCDVSQADFGAVLLALPLDRRHDWHVVGADFESFLQAYEKAEGAKFWEEACKPVVGTG